MGDADAISLLTQVIARLFGQNHAAMLATRAANGNGELLLALVNITGHNRVKKRLPRLQEVLGFLAIHDEVAHRRVETG